MHERSFYYDRSSFAYTISALYFLQKINLSTNLICSSLLCNRIVFLKGKQYFLSDASRCRFLFDNSTTADDECKWLPWNCHQFVFCQRLRVPRTRGNPLAAIQHFDYFMVLKRFRLSVWGFWISLLIDCSKRKARMKLLHNHVYNLSFWWICAGLAQQLCQVDIASAATRGSCRQSNVLLVRQSRMV